MRAGGHLEAVRASPADAPSVSGSRTRSSRGSGSGFGHGSPAEQGGKGGARRYGDPLSCFLRRFLQRVPPLEEMGSWPGLERASQGPQVAHEDCDMQTACEEGRGVKDATR